MLKGVQRISVTLGDDAGSAGIIDAPAFKIVFVEETPDLDQHFVAEADENPSAIGGARPCT
jgi:hypothetical protein